MPHAAITALQAAAVDCIVAGLAAPHPTIPSEHQTQQWRAFATSWIAETTDELEALLGIAPATQPNDTDDKVLTDALVAAVAHATKGDIDAVILNAVRLVRAAGFHRGPLPGAAVRQAADALAADAQRTAELVQSDDMVGKVPLQHVATIVHTSANELTASRWLHNHARELDHQDQGEVP